ncbi:hypothetical protein Glo7428_2863 [Gloeocapsa sp. PCC 7428]|nr:hypothetical protein Glo7428_2863 [Gloeocapsa sp. PCC 7428]
MYESLSNFISGSPLNPRHLLQRRTPPQRSGSPHVGDFEKIQFSLPPSHSHLKLATVHTQVILIQSSL